MKKRGFALIAAIFFIIIISTIAITALSTASMTAKDTVNAHTREQALLLAQSATEFAVMAMQAHDYNGINCLEHIDLSYPGFDIDVDLYYIDNSLGCTNANSISPATAVGSPTHMALVDVTVRSISGDLPPIVYNRRTLQKP